MRIAHVIDYFQPQLGYQETFLAREHKRLGHEVHVITSNRYFPFPDYEKTVAAILGPRKLPAGIYKEDGITIHRLPVVFESWSRVWIKGLIGEIESINPEVIFVHGIESITSFRIAIWRENSSCGCKVVYDCHMIEAASRSRLSGLFKKLYKKIIRESILGSANAIVAITQETKRYMSINYGIPTHKVRVIPLGVDPGRFTCRGSLKRAIRTELNVGQHEMVFVYAGKIIPEKGVDLAIKAFSFLARLFDGDRIRFMIVGSGPYDYRVHIERYIKDMGFFNRVMWIEAVPNEELFRYYCAADVGVWPKEVTITHLEAISCGLPIIVSNDPAAMERVAWKNGFTCCGESALDLGLKMRVLVVNVRLRKSMGKRGSNIVRDELSWNLLARKFIEASGVSNNDY